MDLAELERLLELMARHGVRHLETPDYKITLRKPAPPAAAAPATALGAPAAAPPADVCGCGHHLDIEHTEHGCIRCGGTSRCGPAVPA